MSINSPASYLPACDSFIAHWTGANTALGAAGPIAFSGGVVVASLQALRDTLATQRTGVVIAQNDKEGARATIETLKAGLLQRLNQFNAKLTSLDASPTFLGMLPKAFTVTAGMGRVIPPLDDVEDVWDRYEAETEVILPLMGGYTLITFGEDLAALKAAYTAYQVAENTLKDARGKRNETQDRIYAILKNYRLRIPTEFAEGSAVFESLPRLTPLPGHTPDAVTATGTYNQVTGMAELSWTISTDSSLEEYELRGLPGPDYDGDDDSVIANFAPGAPRTWTGDFGLSVPGSSASFRIYVKTDTGNEAGSNTITITRPVE